MGEVQTVGVLEKKYSRRTFIKGVIATGATVRREASRGPRRIEGGKPGPEWFFAGLERTGPTSGYLATDPGTGGLAPAPATERLAIREVLTPEQQAQFFVMGSRMHGAQRGEGRRGARGKGGRRCE